MLNSTGTITDHSPTTSCGNLQEVHLDFELPVTDLSVLSGSPDLQKLRLDDLPRLRDISELSGKKALTEPDIHA